MKYFFEEKEEAFSYLPTQYIEDDNSEIIIVQNRADAYHFKLYCNKLAGSIEEQFNANAFLHLEQAIEFLKSKVGLSINIDEIKLQRKRLIIK